MTYRLQLHIILMHRLVVTAVLVKAHKASGSAASFNCTGAVRKAGFLSVKKWLLRKKHQVNKLYDDFPERI